MRRLIILGGGYGGISAAKELLDKDLPSDVQLMLIDRMPFQGLKTEYYALASGTIADVNIRVPFPSDERLTIKYGEITDIDLANQTVQLDHRDIIDYDTLIIALGCTDKYHGIPGAQLYTHSIQTLQATRETYQQINNIVPYGQVTIVGGGLSGVELAAELRESRADLNIRILDRGASILSTFPDKLVKYVREWFDEHEVEMVPYCSLSRVEPGILYNKGEEIWTDAAVWTAGIQPVEQVQKLDVPKDPQGRVLLNELHQIPHHRNVYVVGDCASSPFSPSGQLAEAQGKQVAEVIHASWKGETPKLSRIKLKGVLGSLGKNEGFGVMGKRTVMTGRVPRVLKSGVLWMSKRHFG
ncbi:NAD(P)/FAD-dependent oxidoreductase [Ferviditalea candida]|uniref:FAD-dependent oxidoreductase n=1 Tax=Ferviditalea candida TaxID=3108399 RepID=A0ABU5ZD99_9BACL|nr:FAD-dependent oxidoreductase [Paenibacillaceae bacterium T2]